MMGCCGRRTGADNAHRTKENKNLDELIQKRKQIEENQRNIGENLCIIIFRYLTLIALYSVEYRQRKDYQKECCKLLLQFLNDLRSCQNCKKDKNNDTSVKVPAKKETAEQRKKRTDLEVETIRKLFEANDENVRLSNFVQYLQAHPNPKIKALSSETFQRATLKADNNADFQRLSESVEQWKQDIVTIQDLRAKETLTTIPEPKTTLQELKIQPMFVTMLKSSHIFQELLEQFISTFQLVNEPTLPDQDTPLHYAVSAGNTDFIKWLLVQPAIDVNSRNEKNKRKTPLFVLCEQFDKLMKEAKSPEKLLELEKTKSNIRLLLESRADFNICSFEPKLPFELLMRHVSKEGVDVFIKDCRELFRDEIVSVSKEGKVEYNAKEGDHGRNGISCTVLEIYLRFKDAKFAEMFEGFRVDEKNVKAVIRNLLHAAVDVGLDQNVKLIVNRYEKIIFIGTTGKDKVFKLKYRVELKGLLKKAYEKGNTKMLALLLEKINDQDLINDDPIIGSCLTLAYSLANSRKGDASEVLNCAKILAMNDKVDLTRVDDYGNTALHLALQFGFTEVALVIAKQNSVFLGVRNSQNITPLHYASHDFCTTYFDQCIETDTGRKYREAIRLNLNGLNPYYVRKERFSKPMEKKKTVQWRQSDKFPPHKRPRFDTEMDVVKLIENSRELRPLLLHPVVHTFILIKWLRYRLFSYINLGVMFLTAIAFAYFSIQKICSGNYAQLSLAFSSIGFSCMLLQASGLLLYFLWPYLIAFWTWIRYLLPTPETSQGSRGSNLLSQHRHYSPDVIVVSTFDLAISLLGFHCMAQPHSTICSITFILFAVQLIRRLGFITFNPFSTYMYMFDTVALNFIKSFLLYCPVLVAFIFSFYLSYNDASGKAPSNSTEQPPSEESFNSFVSVKAAAVKTLVMTIGELDAASSGFVEGRALIFVLFIFFAPIVILNLINGLAVSDIAAIRDESKLISMSKKVSILARYEFILQDLDGCLCRLFSKNCYDAIYNALLEPFFRRHSFMIMVRPSESRKLFVKRRVGKFYDPKEPIKPKIQNQSIRQQNSSLERRRPQSEDQSQRIPEHARLLGDATTITMPNDKHLKTKPKQQDAEEYWNSVPINNIFLNAIRLEDCLKLPNQDFSARIRFLLMESLDEDVMEETLRIADQNIKKEKSDATLVGQCNCGIRSLTSNPKAMWFYSAIQTLRS